MENLDNRKLCCDHSRWEMSYWFEQIDLNKELLRIGKVAGGKISETW